MERAELLEFIKWLRTHYVTAAYIEAGEHLVEITDSSEIIAATYLKDLEGAGQ